MDDRAEIEEYTALRATIRRARTARVWIVAGRSGRLGRWR